ncbi:hypothetical protein LBMAG53_12880 [Planctomycetota bacterium]|nr:hypothetical protein LBMAG53_12880 [Planctomycetota bacterium]
MVACAVAALATPAQAGESYAMTAGEGRTYGWHCEQTVFQQTLGDRIEHRTIIDWDLDLLCREVLPDRIRLSLTVLRVQASHQSPGTRSRIDTGADREPDPGKDPVLGHLAVFHHATIGLELDPATGRVLAASGGERLVAAALAHLRAKLQGEPSAILAERTRAAYADPALARMWTRILERPPAGAGSATAALTESWELDGGVVRGAVDRRWSGAAYTLALPAGVRSLPVTISSDPALPVTGSIESVTGDGVVRPLTGGWPGGMSQSLGFRLVLDASTQPVTQEHRLTVDFAPRPLR